MSASKADAASRVPARWYFDYISPFAYLQWQRLRCDDTLAIEPVPILFAAILDALDHKGPAELAGKRRFTYRYVHWRARHDGFVLRMPPAHPFNPLAALRLSIALGNTREAIDAIYDHLWQHGEAGDTAEALAPVGARLGVDVATAIADPGVKRTLKSNTDTAIARGVFGVPTLEIGDELFWGDDATGMALDYARGELRDADYARIDTIPEGVRRR